MLPAPATSAFPPPPAKLCRVDEKVVGSGGMGSRDWSLIPADLLDHIASKSADVEDYVRFRAVCKPWRSATSPTNPKLRPSLPWLLLTYNPDDPFRRFYSLSRRKFYTFHLPETLHCFLWGTPHGCLLMADSSFSLSLLNPLTRVLTHLPAITSFPKGPYDQYLRIGNGVFLDSCVAPHMAMALRSIPRHFYCDVFMSGDNECFVVVAAYNSPHLQYCKVGAAGTTWTMLHAPPIKGLVESIAYHNHRFYAVYNNANLVFWDIGSTESEGRFVQSTLSMVPRKGFQQMVAFRGELMLVVYRYKCGENVKLTAAKFAVYKLTGDGWSNLEDIGDSSMFMAWESKIMMGVGGDSAHGWRMNSIYFADVYDAEWLETFPLHRIHQSSMQEKKLFTLSTFQNTSNDVFPPMWIMPSLLHLGDYATPI